MRTLKKPRNFWVVASWAFLFAVVTACIIYMSLHVTDMLDSDAASEMILAKHLSNSGKILSDQWYYSTELRVVNTQLFYAFFFNFSNDWQLVRILGNISIYLVFLASLFFLCKQLKIDKYFPLCAGLLFLPLSEDYTAVMLFGAYYVPRISMMFVILGALIPLGTTLKRNKYISTIMAVIACVLSFALGLEGPRMILILFIPIAILVSLESCMKLRQYLKTYSSEKSTMFAHFQRSGFLTYFSHSFAVCLSAALGFCIHQLYLSKIYSFNHFALIPGISLSSMKSSIANELVIIGNLPQTKVISISIIVLFAILVLIYLFAKFNKSLIGKRFIGLAVISYAVFTIFCITFQMGRVPRYFVPVAILFFPAIAVVLSELPIKHQFRKLVCTVLVIEFLLIGITGYQTFYERRISEYTTIVKVLEREQFQSGYATFWNGNVITELSDGMIDIWAVTGFDDQTAQSPDLFLWLQDKSHTQTLPTKKSFVIWSREEYNTYQNQSFDYIGRVVYSSEKFVVYELVNH